MKTGIDKFEMLNTVPAGHRTTQVQFKTQAFDASVGVLLGRFHAGREKNPDAAV